MRRKLVFIRKYFENIVKNAYTNMFILRRLKALGCERSELINILKQQIISICEQSIAWWAPMITKVESSMLESVLKCGLHIILDKEYLSFGNALKVASLKSLCHRRKELFFNFSEKTLKNPRFQQTVHTSGIMNISLRVFSRTWDWALRSRDYAVTPNLSTSSDAMA